MELKQKFRRQSWRWSQAGVLCSTGLEQRKLLRARCLSLLSRHAAIILDLCLGQRSRCLQWSSMWKQTLTRVPVLSSRYPLAPTGNIPFAAATRVSLSKNWLQGPGMHLHWRRKGTERIWRRKIPDKETALECRTVSPTGAQTLCRRSPGQPHLSFLLNSAWMTMPPREKPNAGSINPCICK